MAKTVRYVKDTGGLNVRNDAAGTIVRAINYGNLMIYDSADAPVKKALGGVTYTWIKVTYYYGDPVTDSATGWVAQENTAAVSTSKPTKSSVVTDDRVLRQNEVLINARYVCNYLLGLFGTKKWSKNAVCAILGNMEAESTISPGRWQNGYQADSNGYGIVMWTPSTKYLNWLNEQIGGTRTDINLQIARILEEVEGTYEQWDSSKRKPGSTALSFKQFTTSTKSISELAEYFLRCYEQPNSVSTKVVPRQNLAKKWGEILTVLGDIS